MGKTTCRLLLLALLLACFSLNGQDRQYYFWHITQENGLSQSTNSFLNKDSRGYTWISSTEGLNRFDGKSVKSYQLSRDKRSDNNVTSHFFETPEGDLWFSTNRGLHRYIRSGDSTEYQQIVTRAGDTLLTGYSLIHFDRQKNRIWLKAASPTQANQSNLHLYDPGARRDSVIGPLRGARQKLWSDEKNNRLLLISYMFFGSGRMPGVEFWDLVSGKRDTLFNQPAGAKTNEILPDQDGNFWMGTDDGLGFYAPQNRSANYFRDYNGRRIGRVWSLVSPDKTTIFLSTPDLGILVFDTGSRTFIRQISHNPAEPGGIGSNNIRELHLDDQQNLWASIWGRGVDFTNLQKNKFPALLTGQEATLQGNFILSISARAPGSVFCGTSTDKVHIFEKQGDWKWQKTYDLSDPASKDRPGVSSLYRDREGLIWAVVGKKLWRYEPYRSTFQPIPGNLPYFGQDLIQLSGGRRLVATYVGIFELLKDGNGFAIAPCQELAPWSGKICTKIFQDHEGYIYFAFSGEDLLICKETPTGIAIVKNLSGTGNCKAFLEDQGGSAIWVATSSGLGRIDKTGFEFRLLEEKRDGLPAENYYAILPDQAGHLWLSSNRGILRYDPDSGTHHRFSIVDGLQANEFNTNAYYLDPSGEMWFGGVNGLNVFYPEKIALLPYVPALQITGIRINDQPSGLNPDLIPSLTLRYSENTVSFDVAAIEYSAPLANRVEYRMLGAGEQWVKMENYGVIRYPKMHPGHYTLEIRASNSDLVWSGQTLKLDILVHPPWWQTWWFYLLCLATATGLVYAWFQYRLRQALKIERMRVKISSDLHDDVGTTLSGLAMQSEILELTASEKDKPRLQRIAELSRSAMSRMRDTVWAIDARKDKLEDLVDRMREHAEETLSPKDFRYKIELTQIDPRKNLPSHIRQNLYLIFKEAVTNIAKHSNGNSVEVHIRKLGPGLEMVIRDNGQVEEKTYKTTGLGLSNMEMRAKQIGGMLEVEISDGYVTTLKLPSIS